MLEDVPADRRRPRERMISLADGYFNTLELNDGQLFTQFTPDCSRRENGVWTANDPHPGSNPDPNLNLSAYGKISCEAGFKLGNYRWDDELRARRFPLVDEEKGLVLAGGFIDHSGQARQIHDDRRRGARFAAEVAAFVLLSRNVQDSGRRDSPR